MQTQTPVRNKSMVWVIFALGAALSWGFYGPMIQKGHVGLGNPLKVLLCVGLAYFLIGVLVPVGTLGSSGLTGWKQAGVVAATIGGALGAGKVAKQTVQRIAEAHGAKPMQVALAWLLQRSPLMLPIPGTSSVEHLEENMLAGSLRVTEEEFGDMAGV